MARHGRGFPSRTALQRRRPRDPGVALQTVQPNGDVTTTGWTNELGGTTSLYASVDETVLDTADYVTATFA